MEKQDKDILPEAEKEGHLIGRRKLLKMLVATVGAAEASFLLPEKWTKPLFDAIIVPAHAATSGPPPTISNFTIEGQVNTGNAEIEAKPATNGYPYYTGKFEYSDPGCEVDVQHTKLNYYVSWGGRLNFNSGATIENLPDGSQNGTPCSGMISFSFITQTSNGAYYPINYGDVSIQLDVNGRLSKFLTQTIIQNATH